MSNIYDAIIVGGGPAGLSAAIYMARARFRVLVIEKEKLGGQITITSEVVNYPGILSTTGEKLTADMARQAQAFGAEFLTATVTSLELAGDYKTVHTDRGDFQALGVVYAAGAHPRQAGFTGEAEFRGHGVAYCATCDGEFFTGKDIFVIGGGYAAVEEGLFLTKYGKHIYMVVRGDDFSISTAAVKELKSHPHVTVLYHTQVERIEGDMAVRQVVLQDRRTGELTRYQVAPGDFYGVFVFVGYAPENALLQGQVELNPQGYVLTDRNQKTNLDGVYAAGDICVKNLRQVVTAVSDGAIAATSLERYLGDQYRKLHIQRVYAPKAATPKPEENKPAAAEAGAFLDDETRQALSPVLARLERPLLLRLYDDGSDGSLENKKLLQELSSLCSKLSYEICNATEDRRNTLVICDKDGQEMGMNFHGVPGGHEFNSFILALYNAAGPGQAISEAVQQQIASLSGPIHMEIAVSLSCTMCPDLVAAAERIAAERSDVVVDVYDLSHYPEMQKKYNIMSVPCLIVDGAVHFGKKNVEQLVDLLVAGD